MSDQPRSEEELCNEVVHRTNRGESKRRIALQLGVSRWKVAEIIRRYGHQREAQPTASDSTAPESTPPSLGRPPVKRPSKLDAFEPQLLQLLERYPNITNVRLYEELKASGYSGRYSILSERIRKLRDRPTKPLTVRFETGPGVQAQMDWSTYEIDFIQEGRRKVQLFSYILGYSRRQYIHFTERQDFETTKRIHGTTKKTPLELHAEELPLLLSLPSLQFDTAQVVYRIVDTDGTIQIASNRYSVPWQLVAELLPVRILETELVVYNQSLSEVARHVLFVGQTGQRRIAAEHLPPRDHEAQMKLLRERYTALGEIAIEFLDGERHVLLGATRSIPVDTG